jgi:ketosteroid isomerase-like protein
MHKMMTRGKFNQFRYQAVHFSRITLTFETMKLRLLVALAGLAISFTLPTFAEQKGAVDPKVDQQIRALAAKFDEAINDHNPAAVAALYTEDGVHVAGGVSHGRQAIEKSYADTFRIWRWNGHFTRIDRLIAVGNEVHGAEKWSQSYQNASGVRYNEDGYYTWILISDGNT